MLKVMTINMWRYHDWDNRKNNLIALINKEAPDCIALQEVQTNHAFSDHPSAAFIAEQCGYSFKSFAPTLMRTDSKDRDGNRTQRVSEGQAFLSKYPITSVESYFLETRPEYPEDKAVLFTTVDAPDGRYNFCTVHFANSKIAYPQLDEVLALGARRGLRPIILGDYNIYGAADYKHDNLQFEDYVLSSELAQYISFPADNDSLDYIGVPATDYTMSHVMCHEAYVSDHRALSAVITRR